MKIDTGAMGNTLPLRTYRQMMPENMKADGTPDETKINSKKIASLTAYNMTPIKCFGSINLLCNYGTSQWKKFEFHIVDVQSAAVCGLPMAEELGLVTLHCAINMPSTTTKIESAEHIKQLYPDQFDKIGNLPGTAKLYLQENAVPFIDPPRKYSIHLKPKLQSELDKMEAQGVISKVKGHSDWCSSLVTSIKKDGSLRLCLDPKKLNQALRRCPHKTQTIEEISHHFHGAKYFSKLDAKSGYWGVALDVESQLLTTFRTPFGRYKFLKLPFGLSVSQDIFQEKIDQILEACPGTVGIADDIAVFGKTEEEHDKNLINLLEQAKKSGLTFNSSKCSIKQSEINYYGVVISSGGMKPDDHKVDDLKAMPAPTSKTELQEFLGLITYLSPFISNLSSQAEPIRELLRKDVPFEWSADYQKVFDHLKTLISTDACLKYYDSEAPTYLMVDASQRGLGAALLQPDKQSNGSYGSDLLPVAFASKSLSKAQKNYVNIEREMLAITFGIKRLHTYLYNRPFVVLSDHKPLEMICQKPLTVAPARLQAMLLSVQEYDFTVRYAPGTTVGLADALSRLPNPANNDDLLTHANMDMPDTDIRIEHIQFSQDILDRIRRATQDDPTLCELKQVIYNGWPDTQQGLPKQLRTFWSYRDELSIDDALILKGERIYIPEPIRADIIKNLHTGHLGIVKTQLRAKKDVYWPNINSDIENACKGCEICQKHHKSQTAEPLMQTDVPPKPWCTVGTDIFQIGDVHYIIIADYFSKLPIVEALPKPATSETVANIMKRYIGIFGIPDIVRSDNGPHFIGQAFVQLQRRFGFTHITSSPRYPKSNGFIERQIDTVKRTIIKAKESGQDSDLALLRLRTTPISNKIGSPAELMFQRRIKDTLPFKGLPTDPMHDHNKDELHDRRNLQKQYHDRGTKPLPPLFRGQQTRYQDVVTGKWLPATVQAKASEPRSYVIKTSDGQTLRRNRIHLREVDAPSNDQPEPQGARDMPTSRPFSETPTQNGSPPTQPTPDPNSIANAPPASGMKTVTRSGREIRKPARYT